MKRKPEKEPNNERWLLTYSDLITLLMIFFIILYAMSNVDKQKFESLAQGFNTTMGGGSRVIENIMPFPNDGTFHSDTTDPISPNTGVNTGTTPSEDDILSQIKDTLDKYISYEKLNYNISTSIEERGVIITLKDTLFFDTGKTDIKPEAKKNIIKLGEILNKIDNYIRIEGHTDNVPISSSLFKSNWELSVLRSTEVAHILIDKSNMPPDRISVVGYGEFRPIDTNDTELGKSHNRRVDIVILNSKFNTTENK